MLAATNIPPASFRKVLLSVPNVFGMKCSQVPVKSMIPRLKFQGRIAFIPVISQKSIKAGYSSSP